MLRYVDAKGAIREEQDESLIQVGDTVLWEGKLSMNAEVVELWREERHAKCRFKGSDMTRWLSYDEIRVKDAFKGGRRKLDKKPDYRAPSDGFYLTAHPRGK